MRYYPNYFDDFFNDTKKQDTNTVLRTDIYEKDGYYQIYAPKPYPHHHQKTAILD